MVNTLAVTNQKGGTGKTTIASNIGGIAGLSGWRVLLVDLDPQGNLARDLGVIDHPDNDDGAGLTGMLHGQPPPPLIAARDGLDLLPGGSELDRAERALHSATEPAAAAAVGYVLDQFPDYDLIIVDCPVTPTLIRAGLGAVDACLIPVKLDDASIDGLVRMARDFDAVRGYNSHLEVLGVVMFAAQSQATKLRAEVRAELDRLLSSVDVPILSSVVRDAPRAAWDMRHAGQLVYEYERAFLGERDSELPFWERARQAFRSKAAPGLAGDMQALTEEVLRWFAARAEMAGV